MISSPLFSYLDLVEYLVANGAPATIASRTVHDVADRGARKRECHLRSLRSCPERMTPFDLDARMPVALSNAPRNEFRVYVVRFVVLRAPVGVRGVRFEPTTDACRQRGRCWTQRT